MELELANVQSEMLVIGSFFKDPTLYLTYSTSIVPKYDFSDKTCEFLWELFSDYYVCCFTLSTSAASTNAK